MLLVILLLLAAGLLESSARAAAGQAPLAGSARGGLVSLEFVPVAYLDPDTVLTINVVTGRLRVSGLWVSPAFAGQRPTVTDVVGLEDPLSGHELFGYAAGGMPGEIPAGPTPSGGQPLPAPGALRVWGAPREVASAGLLAAVVLADGRRVRVRSNPDGRVSAVAWPAPSGRMLRTRVRYAGALTVITDPFGVSRAYRHDARGHAAAVVPAGARGPDYSPPIVGELDNPQAALHIQGRESKHDPAPALERAAGPGWGGIAFDSAANGGYVYVELSSLERAREVERALRREGLLDVSAIVPVLDSARELNRANDSLRSAFLPIAMACHLAWGEALDMIDVTVSESITAAEVATLDRALQTLPAWARIERAPGASVCLEPQTGPTSGQPAAKPLTAPASP